MLAFYNDFIANFEGGFTKVAIRSYKDTIVTHIFANIPGDIFFSENQIMKARSDELKNYVK